MSAPAIIRANAVVAAGNGSTTGYALRFGVQVVQDASEFRQQAANAASDRSCLYQDLGRVSRKNDGAIVIVPTRLGAAHGPDAGSALVIPKTIQEMSFQAAASQPTG